MHAPLVSIIIPAYNAAVFLPDALQSVIDQTYRNWEIIVVDDSSVDDPEAVVIDFKKSVAAEIACTFIRHEKNRGVSAARKTGLDAASGELIAFLDADDAFNHTKLEIQVKALEANPGAVLCHSKVTETGYSSSIKSEFISRHFDLGPSENLYMMHEEPETWTQNRICNSSVMVRRSVLTDIDFAVRFVHQYEDWMLWLLVAAKGAFIYLPQTLLRYRVHDNSFTSKMAARSAIHHLARLEMLSALISRLNTPDLQSRAQVELESELGKLITRLSPGMVQKVSAHYPDKKHFQNRLLLERLHSVEAELASIKKSRIYSLLRKLKSILPG